MFQRERLNSVCSELVPDFSRRDAGVRLDQSTRLVSIQALRIIAAVSVVLAHLSLSFQTIFGRHDAIWDFFDGNFGVDLFFVISGFVILYSSRNLSHACWPRAVFLGHRAARLVPLYWLATTLLLIQAYHMSHICIFSWQTIVGSYIFLPFPTPQGGPILIVGWTLNIEMFFYMIFSISVPFSTVTTAILTATILTALSFIGQIFYYERSLFLSGFSNPLMIEFVFGIWLAVIYLSGFRMRIPHASALMLAALLMICLADKSGAQNLTRAFEWGGAFSCMIAATTFMQIDHKSFLWAPVILAGDASYAIYLFHWFIIMNPPQIILHLIPPIVHPGMYSVVMVSTTIIAGVCVHIVIEKPLVRYLRRHMRRVGHREPSQSVRTI